MNQVGFLTSTEVAGLLRVSDAHVRRHYQQLGGIRIGRRLRFPSGVIRRLAESGTLGDSWHDASPVSPSTNAAPQHSASDTGRMDAAVRNAATPRGRMRKTVRRNSVDPFAADFPEYQHLLS